MRTVPVEFDPDLLHGERARQHSRREDAFQQMLGDALGEIFAAGAVHVAATGGRDGAIDVYAEGAALNLPGPLVVEAKDHDATARDPWKNVLAGWAEVAAKLEKASEEGWPPPYDPWRRTRAYVYCVSLRLNQSRRDELERRIRTLFDGLDPARRPPLETVLVKDWADVRRWLEGAPRTLDSWMGLGEARLRTHKELRNELRGFRRFLLEEDLPYLPVADAELHPRRLLVRLRALAGERGVLVVGPGGVGKTRLGMEVAALADAAGYRVLHALAGEPALTTDNLARAILAGAGASPSPTLLVLDYLDQMEGLDLGRIHRWLLPEAAHRGIELSLLANARPGESDPERSDRPARSALFERLELTADEGHARDLSQRMFGRVAPLALERLGAERMEALCGRRPILALLAAREVERRMELGGGEAAELEHLRSPELLFWLQSRLRSARLEVPEARGLQLVEPDAEVVAAAAVLAAAPQAEFELARVAEAASTTVGSGDFVVDQLQAMGWLEAQGSVFATPHDVVADEVLDQVLRRRPSASLRREVLERVLLPARSMARTLGRHALAIRRLLGTGDALVGLEEACVDWLEASAGEVGQTLAAAPPDEAAYSLGSVFSGAPWLDAAGSLWSPLVDPWLDRHGTLFEARHLLYRGLKHLPVGAASDLARQALRWADVHRRVSEASFVLAPLLERSDLSPEESSSARSFALSWLGSYSGEPDAQFVLHPLLKRSDMNPEESSSARSYALSWLGSYSGEPDAQFVLHPLLDRPDLTPEESSSVHSHALGWLGSYSGESDAGFVLHPLLERPDLTPEESVSVRSYALSWLGSYSGEPEAQFVLHPLLDRQDLSPKESSSARSYALSWLGSYSGEPEAQFVLPPLLDRPDLSPEESSAARSHALGWLGSYSGEPEAQFVLRPLLDRPDLGAKEREAVWRWALAWVDEHAGVEGADFVLGSLLRSPGLPPSDQLHVGRVALTVLETLVAGGGEATFLLRECLSAKGLPWELTAAYLEVAFAWCRANPEHPKADFALTRMLREQRIEDSDWLEASNLALDWLRRAPHARERDFLLNSLFIRTELHSLEAREWLLEDARKWLASFDRGFQAGRLRGTLVKLEVEARTVAPERLRDHVEAAAEMLSRKDLVGAGLSLAVLYPATARPELFELHREVLELIHRYLKHPQLDPRIWQSFSASCEELLDGGAWPYRALGEKALAAIGVRDLPGMET